MPIFSFELEQSDGSERPPCCPMRRAVPVRCCFRVDCIRPGAAAGTGAAAAARRDPRYHARSACPNGSAGGSGKGRNRNARDVSAGRTPAQALPYRAGHAQRRQPRTRPRTSRGHPARRAGRSTGRRGGHQVVRERRHSIGHFTQFSQHAIPALQRVGECHIDRHQRRAARRGHGAPAVSRHGSRGASHAPLDLRPLHVVQPRGELRIHPQREFARMVHGRRNDLPLQQRPHSLRG